MKKYKDYNIIISCSYLQFLTIITIMINEHRKEMKTAAVHKLNVSPPIVVYKQKDRGKSKLQISYIYTKNVVISTIFVIIKICLHT